MEPPRNLLLTLLNHPSHKLTEDEIVLLWKYLCPRIDGLRTVEDSTLQVIDQGKIRQSSGPDVEDVKIELNGIRRGGDVEIHRQTADWYNHGHHHDDSFNTVILHVVMTGEARQVRREDECWIETLRLGTYSSICRELVDASVSSSEGRRVRVKRPCYREDPSRTNFIEPLNTMAMTWLGKQAAQFRDNTNETLLKNLIGALGFSRNHEGFNRLASRLDFDEFRGRLKQYNRVARLEGYLLGLGGWFRDSGSGINRSIRRRLSHWTSEMKSKTPRVGHNNWTQSGVRPQARPIRRWVLFGWTYKRLISRLGSMRRWFDRILVENVKNQPELSTIQAILDEAFYVPDGTYWKNHYSLSDEPRETVPSPVGTRWYDQVTMNVILPYLYFNSVTNGDRTLLSIVKQLLANFPSRMDNRRTRRLERQWGFEEGTFDWENGFHQQAGVFLYKQGCVRDRCGECPLNRQSNTKQENLFTKSR